MRWMVAFLSLMSLSLEMMMVLSPIKFFEKKTHTEQYLHASSHHFPAQKLGVLSTLATRELRISDESHLEGEKTHLLNVFCNNGYSIL